MEYTKLTCDAFVKALASKEPAPGGGGASALVGAIGAALGQMVGSLTVGKKKFASVEPVLLKLMRGTDALSCELLELAERDAEVFLPLAAAYGMPKSTEADRAAKASSIQSALKGCCEVPLAVMEKCVEAIKLLEGFAEHGSPLAESDAGVGAAMCRAALLGASLNVFINTKAMDDRALAAQLNARADAALASGVAAADAVFGRVERRLRGAQSAPLPQDAAAKNPAARARVLRGAPVADALTASVSRRTQALRDAGAPSPTLAIVRVGARPDDLAYERAASARCKKAGVLTRLSSLPADCGDAALQAEIRALGEDDSVHGILLFRPLPGGMDDDGARAAIPAHKDVDGVTDSSFSAVFAAGGGAKSKLDGGASLGAATDGLRFAPCTARACVEILDHYGVEISGKRVVVVGRSTTIGRPVSFLLMGRHATVTICHTRTENLASVCREADILIACAGRVGVLTGDCFTPNQTVIDVGIHVNADGSMRGDVDFDEASEAAFAGAITPVPGGVGSVTASVLAANTAAAAEAAFARKKSVG